MAPVTPSMSAVFAPDQSGELWAMEPYPSPLLQDLIKHSPNAFFSSGGYDGQRELDYALTMPVLLGETLFIFAPMSPNRSYLFLSLACWDASEMDAHAEWLLIKMLRVAHAWTDWKTISNIYMCNALKWYESTSRESQCWTRSSLCSSCAYLCFWEDLPIKCVTLRLRSCFLAPM